MDFSSWADQAMEKVRDLGSTDTEEWKEYVVEKVRDLGSTDTEEWKEYVVEKVRDLGSTDTEDWKEYVVEKVRDLGSTDTEGWKEYVMEKLKQLLALLEDFGNSIMGKVDETFPPETRVDQIKHYLKLSIPYVIAFLALYMFFRCIRRCCCSRGSGRVKMMIAPGRGYKMPRLPFEANPRNYFRGLRGVRTGEMFV